MLFVKINAGGIAKFTCWAFVYYDAYFAAGMKSGYGNGKGVFE